MLLSKQLADTQAEIRKAASLVVVRDGMSGLEVLVLKRSNAMRFLPGFLSFPGGSLNEADEAVDTAIWANPLKNAGRPDDAAYAIGALRETAEETGGLFAVINGSKEAALHRIDDALQTALLAENLTYEQLLKQLVVCVDGDNLRFVGRWVTPPFMPKRFDTRFFITVATGSDEILRVNPAENDWAKWCSPDALLQAIEEKREKAAPPTIAMLQALTSFSDAETCFRTLDVPGPDPDDPVLRSVLNDL